MANIEVVANIKVDKNARLGKGTFGLVYKGTDQRTGEPVACKEIWVGEEDDDWIERVQREVDAHKNIPPHPNIVRYVGSKKKGDNMWIFTEFCECGDLDKYFKGNTLSDEEKLDIMIQVTTGIDYLHKQNPAVIHRDIKSGNILITKVDGKVRAKLCDLGLAKTLDQEAGKTRSAHTYCGTEGYMSPELFQVDEEGNVRYTKKADVFSNGMFVLAFVEAKERKKLEPSKIGHLSLGRMMQRSKERGGLTTSPVKFDVHDSPSVTQLKGLVSSMISYNPDDRPSIDQVMHRMKEIAVTLKPTAGIPKTDGIEEEFSNKVKVTKGHKAASAGASASGNPPSLCFHHIHGKNTTLSNGSRRAVRGGFRHGVCFSSRPVQPEEHINLRIHQVDTGYLGSLLLGFTNNDPDSLTDLPDRMLYFVKKKGHTGAVIGDKCTIGSVVSFHLTRDGRVVYGVDKGEMKVCPEFSRVDTSKPVWAIIDISVWLVRSVEII